MLIMLVRCVIVCYQASGNQVSKVSKEQRSCQGK